MIPKDLNIPGYDIEALLGKGGMAAVYRARQQSFGREVALKVLNPTIEDAEDFSRRFLQESSIVAKLHHSHIVQVYDVGRYENYFYICMEYLHGGDLANKIRVGLTLKESVTTIKQLADALDFAHRENIIHRDIKPENIMFREDDAAVLTDFGIAKELESQVNLTQTGLVIGTPKYMSPEQIRGEEADHRADIYALGIVFYRCLTNYVPFDGKDMVTTAYLQNNEPVPTLPPEVACFQAIINRMLEKAPEDRFQRGRDIVAALEDIDRKAYSPDLTNLDVAAAAKLAPPTVTRTASGRHPAKTQQPTGSAGIKIDPVARSEGTQIRARVLHNKTVLADHMVPADSLLNPPPADQPLDFVDSLSADRPAGSPSDPSLGDRIVPADLLHDSPLDEPMEAPPKQRNSRTVPVLLSLIFIGVLGAMANEYTDELSRGAWPEVTADVRDRLIKQWMKLKGDDTSESNIASTSGDNILPADTAVESPQPPIDSDPINDIASATPEPGDAADMAAQAALETPATEPNSIDARAEVAVAASSELIDSAGSFDGNIVDTATETSIGAAGGTPAGESVLEEVNAPVEPDISATIEALLGEAEAHMAKKRFRKPADDNAYLKYQQVLELEADNTLALAGIEKIADAYFAMAERAIAGQQFDAARGFLEDAHTVAPHRTERQKIEAKLALAIAEQKEREAMAAAAQQAAQIEELLVAAKSDEEAGRIRAPFGNNALEKYQRILELDPDNAKAIDKLIEYGR